MKLRTIFFLLLLTLIISCRNIKDDDFVYIKDYKIYSYNIKKNKSRLVSDKYEYLRCYFSINKKYVIFYNNQSKSGFINTETKEVTLPDIGHKKSYILKINEKKSKYALQISDHYKDEEIKKTYIYDLNNMELLKELNGHNIFLHDNFDNFLYINRENDIEKIYEMNIDTFEEKLIYDAKIKYYGLGEPIYFDGNIYFKIFEKDGIYFVKSVGDNYIKVEKLAPSESNTGLKGIVHDYYKVSDDGKKLLLTETTMPSADLNKKFEKRIVLLKNNKRYIITEGDEYKWLRQSDFFVYNKEKDIYLCNSDTLEKKLLIKDAKF